MTFDPSLRRRRGLRATAAMLFAAVILAACGDDDPTSPSGGNPDPQPEGTIELMLTARGLDDQPLATNAAGVVAVQVGAVFELEVAYADLRDAGEAIGAFVILTDLLVDTPNVIEPVMSETQQLEFGEELGPAIANDPSGTITFGLEGSVTTFVSLGTDFAADPEGEIVLAMAAFGYVEDVDYTVRRNDPEPTGIGFEIRWDRVIYGGVDAPDLSVIPDFDDVVPTSLTEFSPVGPDGVTPNAAAFVFNLDTSSRTFDDGASFYVADGSAAFDPVRGFTNIGGVGRLVPGGVPEASGDGSFAQPFEVVSFLVRVTAAVSDLEIAVQPAGAAENILMYGQTENVTAEDVWQDDDHVVKIEAS